jgi:glutathione S-transferase
MILYGQYDSPFVRRVGLALDHYGMAFAQAPLSAWGDAAALARVNPLMRVPALVLAEGTVLTDSAAILDHLDEAAPPGRRLVPPFGPLRREVLAVTALATGTADKAVTLFYLQRMAAGAAGDWADRLLRQVGGGMAALAATLGDRAAFFAGANHADIAVACLHRFLAEALPDLAGGHPGLAAHAARAEATAPFQRISQPFIAPT